MTDPGLEQQTLFQAAEVFTESFAALAKSIETLRQSDLEYTTAAQARNNAQNSFTECNKAFVADPASSQSFADFEAAVGQLLAHSQIVQRLRLAKLQVDAAHEVLLCHHHKRLNELKSRFNAFISVHLLST